MLALAGAVMFCGLLTGVIGLAGPWLQDIPHLEDAGPDWYYWQLTERSFWARASAWGGYGLHQLSLWALIFLAQRQRPRWSTQLHRFNWWALGLNGGFATLHVVQTHLFYDGLAPDVSVDSSQNSVIAMLVMVLLMENKRRGLLWGKPLPGMEGAGAFVRRYHGYYFAWAITYTFWFHPTEATSGHLWGFFYTFLLFVQGSLFFTRVHTNRFWTVSLEVIVLVHGTMVAWQLGQEQWTMFGFGFSGLFVLTQMHGLGLSRGARWFVAAVYVLTVVVTYSNLGFTRVHEIIRIPLGELVLTAIMGLIIGGVLRAVRQLRPPTSHA